MVQHRQLAPILRQDIYIPEFRTKKTDYLPISRLQDSKTSQMLEDAGVGVVELLVALDVKVYRPIYQHL